MNMNDASIREAVSIIIVNYNSGELLTECVREALDQARQVIVVDNGSSDSSIEQLANGFFESANLQIVRVERNLGFSVGCNIGLKLATESDVLFLNPDCLLSKTALHLMFTILESDEQTGMVGGMLVNPDGTEQRGARRCVPTPWRALVRAFGLQRFANRWPRLFADFNLHKRSLPDGPIEVEAISGALMLVKKAALQDVGYWDENYFLHCEDLDLCMRFRQKGWKIFFVPAASVVHYNGTCSRSSQIFVEWHKHKGMMRFYRKFFRHQYPGILMCLVALGVWLRFGSVAIFYFVRRIGRIMGIGRE